MLKMWGQPLSGSLWLALLLSLAPSCSLLLSQAPYCSPNLRTTSSLGSQGPCSARSGAAALQHFMLLCNRTACAKLCGVRKNELLLYLFHYWQDGSIKDPLKKTQGKANTVTEHRHRRNSGGSLHRKVNFINIWHLTIDLESIGRYGSMN